MGTLLLSPRNAVDGLGVRIPNGVSMNDQSGTGAGPYNQVVTLIDASQGEILGQTTGAAVVSDVNGTIHDYLRGLVKLTAAGMPAVGPAAPGLSVPVTQYAAVTGAYRMGMVSGTIAAGLAANSPVWALRYGGVNFALVRKINISAANAGTAFTAGVANFQLFAARAYTINASSGTAATLTGNNGKLRTTFGTNNLADLRIAATGALSAGTWTLDAQPLRNLTAGVVATAGAQIVAPTVLYQRDAADDFPVVLAQNEGLVIEATVPATGTWVLSVDVQWDEVVTF